MSAYFHHTTTTISSYVRNINEGDCDHRDSGINSLFHLSLSWMHLHSVTVTERRFWNILHKSSHAGIMALVLQQDKSFFVIIMREKSRRLNVSDRSVFIVFWGRKRNRLIMQSLLFGTARKGLGLGWRRWCCVNGVGGGGGRGETWPSASLHIEGCCLWHWQRWPASTENNRILAIHRPLARAFSNQ